MRELTGGEGVDVVLDSLGGPISLRSFCVLRPGGRLAVFGRYATLSHGRKNRRAVIEWYASIGALWLWAKLSPRRSVLPYQIQKFRDRGQWRPGAVGASPATRSGSVRTSTRWSNCSAPGRSIRWSRSACRSPRRGTRTSCWRPRHRRGNLVLVP